MIESVEFRNFKALRNTTLPLGRFTLIVGPNGSGKSTALQALRAASNVSAFEFNRIATAGIPVDNSTIAEVVLHWGEPYAGAITNANWSPTGRHHKHTKFSQQLPSDTVQVLNQSKAKFIFVRSKLEAKPDGGHPVALYERNAAHPGGEAIVAGPNSVKVAMTPEVNRLIRDDVLEEDLDTELDDILSAIRIYSFDAGAISTPTNLEPHLTLDWTGRNLAGVLDQLSGREPERFDQLNEEMGRLLPEFDHVLLETSASGQKSLLLRTRHTKNTIGAAELSQGTLLTLAILTLAHIPEPPPIVCLEEPDRGIHPRLLRDIRDAMYRLSYPESVGEKRDPVQVIATTHSPYLLDLFNDHPEEVVIADKSEQGVRFERLSDREDIDEILGGAQLGDVWYSGILGGVPSNT